MKSPEYKAKNQRTKTELFFHLLVFQTFVWSICLNHFQWMKTICIHTPYWSVAGNEWYGKWIHIYMHIQTVFIPPKNQRKKKAKKRCENILFFVSVHNLSIKQFYVSYGFGQKYKIFHSHSSWVVDSINLVSRRSVFETKFVYFVCKWIEFGEKRRKKQTFRYIYKIFPLRFKHLRRMRSTIYNV